MDAVRQCVLHCLPGAALTKVGTLFGLDDNDGEDRISALPYELLRDVVSRLPIKDAVRTTVLSPRWRHVLRSTPLVLYDAHLFPASSEDARVATIHRIFAAHPSPLRTVHIVYCFFGVHERKLGEWSRFLAAGASRTSSSSASHHPWTCPSPPTSSAAPSSVASTSDSFISRIANLGLQTLRFAVLPSLRSTSQK
jgi:hypothetical protein